MVPFRLEIFTVPGHQLQAMLQRKRRLEGIRKLPAVLAPQEGGGVGGFLIDHESRKGFEEAPRNREMWLLKSGQDLRPGNHRDRRLRSDLGQIGRRRGDTGKASRNNNLDICCGESAMDARREPRPMVIPLARLATPQTRGFAATLRAAAALRTCRCRKPPVVNDTSARLASWPVRKAVTANVQLIISRRLSFPPLINRGVP